MSSLFIKKPISKNLCLSFTGKEQIFNNISLYNNFPIALMIITKLDPISSRVDPDNELDKKLIEELETDVKLKYINEKARDLFELKDNETSSKIKEQLKQLKLSDKNKDNNNSDKNLYSIIFHQTEDTEFFGSFKNQAMLIWVKFKIIKDDIYISADYFTDERKQIQNELFQSIKFQYIATLFHELYNPINAILVMVEQNKYDDDLRNSFEYQNYSSENVGTHFSLITENEFDKINYNVNIEDDDSNEEIPNNIKGNESLNILLKKYQKCKKLEEYYKSNYNNMKDKEKDIRLLVNIIYIFLENLILYLRLNLGEGKEHSNDDIDNKRHCLSENNSQKSDEENNYKDKDSYLINDKFLKKNSKSLNISKVKETNIINNNNLDNTKLYQDNYFDLTKANKKLNLQVLFHKHLKKFSYLFQFKNIQYFSDFSFLSDKYIITYESIFSDFLGQIYSFLYYIVPKFQGFEISFNIVSENKMKLTFQKANSRLKTGYTHKKFQKKDSFILLGNKFKASNTVKTTEMTIEILYKLAQKLGINVKIMDYEEKTEEKYLTVLMPFILGKDIKNNQKNTNSENGEENLDSLEGNMIIENTIKNLENLDMNNIEKEQLVEIRDTTNKIIENINAKIINNKGNNCKSSKKVSFYDEDKDKNSYNKEHNNIVNNNNINSVNINININKNININNNFNSSSLSSFISNTNNKNISNKSLTENYIISPKNKPKNNNTNEIDNTTKINKGKNLLTLIHEKYSFLDRLRKSGVEILTEKGDENDDYAYNTNIISDEINKKNKSDEQNSCFAEADSENYFEIENDNSENMDDNPNPNDKNISEEIIFNNNYNNIKLQIGEDYWNMINNNKNQANIDNLTSSQSQNNSIRKSKKEKINTILKNKSKYLSSKNLQNKYYNKTLSYNKTAKNMLFIIPEITEHKKKRIVPHPSCKTNNKYLNEFTDCGCNDILLVDDDEFICKTFKNILKKFKLKADCAENGKECLKMLKEKMQKNCKCEKNKYKIIFMDITMPVMDGIEAAKNIQKMIDNKELYDNIKIIFISAHANLDLSSTVSGIKCAVDFHAKPISADKYKHLLDQYYYGT